MPLDLQTQIDAITAYLAIYAKTENHEKIQALLDFCENRVISNGTTAQVEEKTPKAKKSYSRGRYMYLRGLWADVEKLLRKPEFIGRNLGIPYPKEIREQLLAAGAISPEHTEEHVKKTLSDKIGPKKMFFLQANGKLNLYSNITKDPSEVVVPIKGEVATAK